ncbi:MAG: flap endonuclease 1-like [Satyrvirus sp.]|uniref:Flap endonuclease 1-like n=1 Tax=Satyrvirus sp. TaxID=2487771 RepID=A0A3G5AI67_9VIRU|nr:MAG: flap endonuclease 1-like [Satyrvirus sp.]
MGIKNLRKILVQLCQTSGIYHYSSVSNFLKSETRRLSLSQTKNFVRPYCIGIDTYLYAIRYKRVFSRIEFGFFRQIVKSLSVGIVPIYVFDGKAPEQKRKIIEQRKNKRKKIRNKLEEELLNSNNDLSMQNVSDLSFDEIVKHINSVQNKMTDISDNLNESESMDHLLYDLTNTSDEYNKLVKLSKRVHV